jgi:hypothetical protein
MARLKDSLGGNEQQHFHRLTGFHPAHVGVASHRDAVRYLAHVDMYNRQRRERQPQVGLLALTMGQAGQSR